MKYAYLIIAHDQFDCLEKLINILDYDNNDIYVHIDKKNKKWKKEKNIYDFKTNKAKLYFIPRRKVFWGGDTQIKCELWMLRYALKHGNYDYFHLLSGVDFPIKTQDYIQSFFCKNKGKEFVHFDSCDINQFPDKYDYLYFFQNFSNKLLLKLNYMLVGLQKKINFKRKHQPYYKGSNWFSITNDLAKYIISKEDQIKKEYKYTWCCDEVFLQTLIMKSEFKNKLNIGAFDNDCFSNVRYVDWQRGRPYKFKYEDFDELIKSNCLFARKISNDKNNSLLMRLYNYLI